MIIALETDIVRTSHRQSILSEVSQKSHRSLTEVSQKSHTAITMDFVKINFTPDRIKYILYEKIKDIVFDNNGIIFGGYVRDAIISNHYKTIYNGCNSYDIHKFWNKSYQPETAARTLVAKDLDICMYSLEDLSNFLIAIQNIFNDEVGYANISSSDLTVTNENSYFHIPIQMHKKINYTITIGKIPYVNRGIELSFYFDIIVPWRANRQPPFRKLDMLSNMFIMNRQGIVMSNQTGTIIDTMSILNKQKISASIMKDIVEFKTQFCLLNTKDNYDTGNLNYNDMVFKRINKMLLRNFKWNITNLPFTLCDYKKKCKKGTDGGEAGNSCDTCCICLSNFKNNDRMVKIFVDNSTKTEQVYSASHDKCLLKYFETQLENAKINRVMGAENFEFRCPMRNVINFKIMADNIDDIIREKMNE